MTPRPADGKAAKFSVAQPVTGQPQAFIDAGDTPWPELEPLLRLRLAGLLPTDVLEIQAGAPAILDALPGWCEAESRTLIHSEPGNGFVRFWIGKTEESTGGGCRGGAGAEGLGSGGPPY